MRHTGMKHKSLYFLLAIAFVLCSCSQRGQGRNGTDEGTAAVAAAATEESRTAADEPQGMNGEVSVGQEEVSADSKEVTADSEEVSANSEETSAPEETPAAFTPEEGSIFAKLPSFESGSFLFSRMQNAETEMAVWTDTSADDMAAYETRLADQGFSLYDRNQMGDNLYSTWTDEEYTVTVFRIACNENLHIVAEPAGSLPPSGQTQKEKGEPVCEPAMAMVGTNYTGYKNNGMCFVYRLSDGSFVIVDGGFNQPACADALHRALQELAPDPDHIHVSAWIITHAHSDHIGGFYAFTNRYADTVTLDSFIVSLPSEEVFVSSDTDAKHLGKFADNAARYPGARIITAHPGQRFTFSDAVIEMYYTWDLYPDETLPFFNNTSLVFSVTLGGQKVMQMGDCGPVAAEILESAYGEGMKSDIIQTAHHGLVGATAELNGLIDPDIVLWPSSQRKYKENCSLNYNQPLAEADHVYAADQSIWYFTVPFDPDQVKTEDAFPVSEEEMKGQAPAA